MQSLSYWKQFESTGKVEDYLSYSSMPSREGGGSFVPMEPGGHFREDTPKKSIISANTGYAESTGHLIGSEFL